MGLGNGQQKSPAVRFHYRLLPVFHFSAGLSDPGGRFGFGFLPVDPAAFVAQIFRFVPASGSGFAAVVCGFPIRVGLSFSSDVAGFDPPLQDKILKRKYLNDCEIFDVCPEEFAQLKQGKSWKDIPDGPTKSYLQRFQRRSKTKMAVRTVNPESGDQYLHWINYPAKNFLEQCNLSVEKFNLE